MKKFMRVINFVFILFFLAGCGACRKKNEPAIEVNDDGSVEVNPTAAADAEFLAQTQMAEVEATRQYLIGEVEATAEGLQPTQDASIDATPIATLDPAEFYTPPPAGSTTVQLSNTTNCRSGPGTNYSILDVVPDGQPVEVLGVDSSGAYYVVQSPNGKTCWLWSHYASVNGSTDGLVQMTPPAPPKDVYTGDWIEPVTIQVSEKFSWQGHWVVGWFDGGSIVEATNLNKDNDSVFLDYYELDVFQKGNFLDVEITELWKQTNGGSSYLYVFSGVAQVSEDNSMAVGNWYQYELTFESQTVVWAVESHPFVWFQNGNPNQFVGGDFMSLVPCAARGDSELPFPCTWP